MVGRKPYSIDAKNIVARLRFSFSKTIRDISNLTNVPKTTVHRWIQQHAIGRAIRQKRNHRKIWCENAKNIISNTLKDNPFCTLDHIKKTLCEQGIRCKSSSTVSTWIRKNLRFSRKRITGKYIVRNERTINATFDFIRKVSDNSLKHNLDLLCGKQ